MGVECKDLPAIGGEHGISSVYPTLADVIAFKEGTLRVTRGYPRFVVHPYIDALARITVPENDYRCVVSSACGARFLRDEFFDDPDVEIVEREGFAVITVQDEERFSRLFEDARNTGFTLSSRKAKRILCHVPDPEDNSVDECAAMIAGFEKGASADRTFMFSSGMGALFAAMYSIFDEARPEMIIIGNPYVDSIQLFTKFLVRRGFNPPRVVEDAGEFEAACGPHTGIVYFEIPTNPLLRVADIERIVGIAHANGAAVLIDSTIATPYNVSPFEYGADLVMHSTTKFLNGLNDHLGGALLVNPSSKLAHPERIAGFIRMTESGLDPEEGKVLLSHMTGFEKRMEIINRNALLIARYLSSLPVVGRVYYPLLEDHVDYETARRYFRHGASGVVSFYLSDSNIERAARFYDKCSIPGKGPSLGAEETLLCPITLLTYYRASDEELSAMGLDRYLMRISVGTEDPYVIIAQLEAGFRALKD